MNKYIFIIGFFIIAICLCIFLGVTLTLDFNKEDSKNTEKLISRTEDELNYLENNIIIMMNKLNNLNFLNASLEQQNIENNNKKEDNSSDNSIKEEDLNNSKLVKYEIKNNMVLINNYNNIDWNTIKQDIEQIYTMIPNIISDLNSLDLNSEDILKINKFLDQATLAIKKEDKVASINNLAGFYSLFSNYRKEFSSKKNDIIIDDTKSCVLNTYAFIEQDKWEDAKEQTSKAINIYSEIMNSLDEKINKQNRISKTYILLNELNISIDLKDKEIFYMKYRNVMEELVSL